MTHEIWEFINKSSQLIGVLSILPILYSAWKLWAITRTEKVVLEKIRKQPGEKPGILIIDSVPKKGGSIRPQVENYLWGQNEFQSKKDATIIEYIGLKHPISHEDIKSISSQIKESIGKLQSEGVTKYHIFMRVPVSIGALVGGLLYNYQPAIVYQNSREEGYENWGSIKQ
jgi:hypothetical protein